jgi:glycopeptide antibiotics resistance protein
VGFPYYVALIVAVCIAGLAVLVSCVENRHTVGVLLAFYVIAVLIITLFVRTYDLEVKTLLNPLSKYNQIGNSLASDGVKCFSKNKGMIMEIVLNILLFIPLGYLVPAVKDAFRKCWKILLLGLGLSVFIEVSQLVLHMGCFDVADLLHNTLGAGIGYFVWWKWIRAE